MIKKIFFILLLLIHSVSVFAEEQKFEKLNGEEISLKAFKGKVVLLDFWASWCVPCRASFPWMNAISQKYADQGFEVVAINLDKEQKEVERFLKKYPAKFTILLDPVGKSAMEYKVKAMPTSYLLDRNGKIISTHLGFRQDKTAKYEAEISQLLKSK